MDTPHPDHDTELAASIEAARELLCAQPELELAVLFGSAARGEARQHSDLDIGFVPSEALPLTRELALQAELEQRCRRRVDLVRLDTADALLRWRVAREGEVLLEATAGAMARFTARAALDYLDLKPVLDDARGRYLAAVARGAR